MNINLNEQFQVVLTESGAKQWNTHFNIVPEKYRPEPKKAGDKLHEPLWALMQAFGPHIHLGMVEMPFEGNVITRL